MRKFKIIIVAIVALLSACGADENEAYTFEDAVIDTYGTKFNELLFLVNIKNQNGNYIVSQTIDSIYLKVNQKTWGYFKTENVDTLINGVSTELNFRTCSNKFNYLVIAGYKVSTDSINTAGEAVDFLLQRLVLTPGDYVCEIAEIQLTNIYGEKIKIKPRIFANFTVETGMTNAFLGEFEIVIDTNGIY